MNVVKEIQRINERELASGSANASWHAQYKDTAWIFAGNIPFDLTEGDVVCIFSQYGEIIHIELIRDHKTGKPKGFAFLQYEDQRSTILAVDNLNGAAVLGRTLRVDHSYGPKKQKKSQDEEESDEDEPKMNVAPELIQVGDKKKESKKDDLDEEDPMAAYFRDKKEKKSSKKKKHHKHKSSKERSLSPTPPRRSYREESPSRRRNDSPPRRRSYRDDSSPARRSYRDDSPPPSRKSYRRSRSRSRSPPSRRY